VVFFRLAKFIIIMGNRPSSGTGNYHESESNMSSHRMENERSDKDTVLQRRPTRAAWGNGATSEGQPKLQSTDVVAYRPMYITCASVYLTDTHHTPRLHRCSLQIYRRRPLHGLLVHQYLQCNKTVSANNVRSVTLRARTV